MLPIIDGHKIADRLTPQRLLQLRSAPTLHHLAQIHAVVVDVVVLDEFTHDVVVDVADSVYAVFDST